MHTTGRDLDRRRFRCHVCLEQEPKAVGCPVSDRLHYPESVEAIVNQEPDAPTPSLKDFALAVDMDPNVYWRFDKGHLVNLLEEAIEISTELKRVLAELLPAVTVEGPECGR